MLSNYLIIIFILFKTRIDDGRWHRIQILRKRRVGILQVDKNRPVRDLSLQGTGTLNSDGFIWIGTNKVEL